MKKYLALILPGLLLSGCGRGPMKEAAADPSGPQTNAPAIHLESAIAQARAEQKLVLLDFTGSDWCEPCMRLQKEVFSQPAFQAYAASNLVFLEVDFPMKFHLAPEASATNDLLSAQFNVEGFPTLIALDGTGKPVWKHLGAIQGGPSELIFQLEAVRKKSSGPD